MQHPINVQCIYPTYAACTRIITQVRECVCVCVLLFHYQSVSAVICFLTTVAAVSAGVVLMHDLLVYGLTCQCCPKCLLWHKQLKHVKRPCIMHKIAEKSSTMFHLHDSLIYAYSF